MIISLEKYSKLEPTSQKSIELLIVDVLYMALARAFLQTWDMFYKQQKWPQGTWLSLINWTFDLR